MSEVRAELEQATVQLQQLVAEAVTAPPLEDPHARPGLQAASMVSVAPEPRNGATTSRHSASSRHGWAKFQGHWVPKSIGIV